MLDMMQLCIRNHTFEIARYFCLNPVKFFADMHGMLPATLLDIESEIIICIIFPKKNKVSDSKLSNPQFMFIVSSVP